MKNVTITLPDEVYRAARIAAATEGKSLSRYVADRLALRTNAEGFGDRGQAAFAAPGAVEHDDPTRDHDGKRQAIERLRAFLYGPGYPGVSEELAALRASKADAAPE